MNSGIQRSPDKKVSNSPYFLTGNSVFVCLMSVYELEICFGRFGYLQVLFLFSL